MIILMGLAGAGKGTQAKLLADDYGYRTISTGELLRTYATDEQRERMLAGELLNDDEIIAMVDRQLNAIEDNKMCLLDGFPRSVAQTAWVLDQVRQGRFPLTAIIHLLVSEEVVHKRLLGRGRPDDTEESIARRFREYHEVTEPILDHLKDEGIHVYDVNGDQEPEAVHRDIVADLKQAQEL